MTAPKAQQRVSRNDRVNTSKLRRRATDELRSSAGVARFGRRFADGDQRQRDARDPNAYLVPGTHARALRDPLAVHEAAEAAVIEQQQLGAIAQDSAVTPRHASQPLCQRDRMPGPWRA